MQRAGVNTIYYGYDALGRVDSVCRGEGLVARCDNSQYRETDGFLDKLTFSDDSWIEYKDFDLVGNSNSVEFSDGRIMGLGFDSMSNVISITPPNKPTYDLDYSALNTLETVTAPEVGAVGRVINYKSNLDRQLEWIDRPDGSRVDHTYAPVSGELDTISWEGLSYIHDYHDGSRLLKSITSPYNTDLSFLYDGPFLTQTTWSGEISGNVERFFDEDFRLESIKVNGTSVEVLFDDDGVLTNEVFQASCRLKLRSYAA